MSTNSVFTQAFDKIALSLPFNFKWSDGTGYFDPAVSGPEAPSLRFGEIAKSITPGNRRLILIGTRLGNVIVFDRRVNQNDINGGVFVYNASQQFNNTCIVQDAGGLSESSMITLLGGQGNISENVGWLLDHVYAVFKKYSHRS